MAWTAPKTWASGDVLVAADLNTYVRDNTKYLKGQAGAITLEDRLNIPLTSGTNGMGLRFGDASNQYGNMQLADSGGVSTIFFGTNRQYDGTAWQQLNTRAAGLLAISQDTLTYYTFPSSSSTPTQRFTIDNAGRVGVGNVVPLGPLQVHGALAKWTFWEYDGLDATARTIIASGISYGVICAAIVRSSGGGLRADQNFNGITTNGGAASNIYNDGVGNTVALTVSGGAATVARSGGSLTYKVALVLICL